MLKNKIWLGIFLSIILLIFSINGFTSYYKYTQESGDNFYVGTADKSDALEDTNEMRQIIDDLGALLVHSKRDGAYPKNGLFGGTIQIPEAGLKFGNDPANNDIAAYIAGEMMWQTKTELGLDLTFYYLKTEIDTLSKVEAIYIKDIIDSDELAAALGAYYLKTAIDTLGEAEEIWEVTLSTDAERNALTYSDVGAEQADAGLTSLAGLTYAYPSFIKVTATDTYAIRTLAETKSDLAYQLSDMSDVGDTTPTDKYVLVADGDSWESRAISSDDLSDVASIAMLDEIETVTGFWDFTQVITISRAHDNAEGAPFWNFLRARDGDPTDNVSSGDYIGKFSFKAYHTDGYYSGATIRAIVDGTPGEWDMPGRLEFLTTPDGSDVLVLRLAIDNAGNIKMGDGAWTNYINTTAAGVMTAEGAATITATDLVIASQAQGDILYFNGSNWIRLAKGTAGQVLTMNAGGTAPEWQTP